ncbi:DUF5949 family protein [Streptomyces sp. NPDC050416]|uniref:DUF5949 family protein n=1 Tax=Streptomyces sp. NPDC050416 TaxID=3365611 RepID=UPI00378C9AC0
MTSISPETQSVHTDDLGSLVVLSWRGTTPAGTFRTSWRAPSATVRRPGGHVEGHRAAADRRRHPPGEGLVHATQRPSLPVGLLVVPGSAVRTVRHLKSQFVPPET